MSQPPEGPWPFHFPSDVPPSETAPAEGQAYRIVRIIPPGPDDFRSAFECDPGRQFNDVRIAHGVSFHRNIEDSRRTRRRFPPLREGRIAVGILQAQMGVMMKTGWRSHLTVWVRRDVSICAAFATDAEVE